jgi:hypothetical protein
MSKIEAIVWDELDCLKKSKILFVVNDKNYFFGLFGKVLHCGIERTQENFKEFQKAVRQYIDDISDGVEEELSDVAFHNLYKLELPN